MQHSKESILHKAELGNDNPANCHVLLWSLPALKPKSDQKRDKQIQPISTSRSIPSPKNAECSCFGEWGFINAQRTCIFHL